MAVSRSRLPDSAGRDLVCEGTKVRAEGDSRSGSASRTYGFNFCAVVRAFRWGAPNPAQKSARPERALVRQVALPLAVAARRSRLQGVNYQLPQGGMFAQFCENIRREVLVSYGTF